MWNIILSVFVIIFGIPGVGTNVINSAKRAAVPEVAPCIGSTLKIFFLFDCSLSGFVTCCGGGGGSDGGTC
ncbi:hypothetical protein Ahy_A04g020191 isoform B [Arachis hypogaea]|uniref:Uncharacterized protein n=1 Tax=Arachis hypogaea TaxID=3818 RepID=A0A445DH90_ARAHY|nr:hypothetical protein Ahy_A04g020191 isoform B [Arachis hypogaea]